jgi:hypothetical protein
MATHRYLILNDAGTKRSALRSLGSKRYAFRRKPIHPCDARSMVQAGLQDEDYVADRGARPDMLRMAQLVFSPTNWRDNFLHCVWLACISRGV